MSSERPTRVYKTREECQEIVEFIAGEIAAGRWKPGASATAFAKERGMSLSSVSRLTQMAAQRVWGANQQHIVERTATTLVQLDRIASKAEGDRKYKDAVAAISEGNLIAGLRPDLVNAAVTVNIHQSPQYQDDMRRVLNPGGRPLCDECCERIRREFQDPSVVDATASDEDT